MMAETLAEAIRSDARITGITLQLPVTSTSSRMHTVKFSAYADDAATFMSDWRSVRWLKRVFDAYGAASGNVLNISKSKCYLRGPDTPTNAAKLQELEPSLKLIDRTGFFVYLGVPFGDATQAYWDGKFAQMQQRLQALHALNFSVFGRAATGRTYVLSGLLYALRFVSDPGDSNLVRKINSLFRNFVLNNKPCLPSRLGSECYRMGVADACLHPKYGGVGMLDVPLYVSCMRFDTLLRVLKSNQSRSLPVLRALLRLTTWPYNLGVHALFCHHAAITRMFKSSPMLTALHCYVAQWPPCRRTHKITRFYAMREPVFFNASVSLDCHDFGPSYLRAWHRIAAA